MKAYIIYWSNGAKKHEDRESGQTYVLTNSFNSALRLFNEKYSDRVVGSIFDECDDIIFETESTNK